MTPARYRAKVHQVEVAWRVRTSREVTVGPEPRLVLAVRARRDVELLLLRADFPAQMHQEEGRAECLLVQVPHVTGLRRLAPDGEPWVWGQEDADALPMLAGDRPEDRALAPEQVRWYGGLSRCLEHNVCVAPNDYWVWRGRIAVPKGLSLGVIVRADRPMPCRVRMSGV